MPLYRKRMMKNPETSPNNGLANQLQKDSRRFNTIERPSYQIKTEQELRQDVLSMSASSNRAPITPMNQTSNEVLDMKYVRSQNKEQTKQQKKPEAKWKSTESQQQRISGKRSLPKLVIRDAPTP